MLVFRDGRQHVSGPGLLAELTASLRQLHSSSDRHNLIDALLIAGELECALADAASPASGAIAEITDCLAAELIGGVRARAGELMSCASALRPPGCLVVSPPEGFSYYALHPLDYADVASSIHPASGAVAVLGIRSIGTTLSAVVGAALRSGGLRAERITVRPHGHPWERRLRFPSDQQQWIEENLQRSAEFWIVDEGPGLSGSSFLAVGEALAAAGVSRERMRFLCSRSPDPGALRARNASARWQNFRVHVAPTPRRIPREASLDLSGGAWRSVFLREGGEWPAVWPQYERMKVLSADRLRLFKFEGLGRSGAAVATRACILAEAGFSPPATAGSADGFLAYPVVGGDTVKPAAVGAELLSQLSRYCAFRVAYLRAEPRPAAELEHMLRVNAVECLDAEMAGSAPELRVERPAIVDGRMQPHEWRINSEGQLLKLDGVSHGDDHFFPGPTDIAWDLAGAVVEWGLSLQQTEFLLAEYQRVSGDNPRPRLPGFLLAYTLFRLAYCGIAVESLAGTEEEWRFRCEMEGYRKVALRQLASPAVA